MLCVSGSHKVLNHELWMVCDVVCKGYCYVSISGSVHLFIFFLAPLAVNMLSISSYPDSLCVSWQPPLENGGQNISSYQVYVRNDDATPTEHYILHGNLGPSNLTYIIEPLMNSNRYR